VTTALDDQAQHPPPPAATAGVVADDVDLYCPECGYHLRGIEAITRCPECGLSIDREGVARSQIPWVHRTHIGRIRAYWRTLLLATLRPRKLAAEAAGRVEFRDAQRFRLVTASVAAAPFVAGAIAAMIATRGTGIFAMIAPSSIPGWLMYGRPSPALDLMIPWEAGLTMYPTVPLVVLLLFILFTGVHTYWFHPKHLAVVRQNRAVALAYYGCAPLALLPVPALLCGGVAILHAMKLNDRSTGTWAFVRVAEIATILAAIAVFVLIWRSIMTLLRRTTQPGLGRQLLAGAVIPLEWILCAVLALFAIPWVVGYFRLVITSLQD
jgi:hypothetical protein